MVLASGAEDGTRTRAPATAGLDTFGVLGGGIDRIELSDIGVDSFVATDAFVAGDGVIEARFDAAAQQLQVDVNDDGSFGPGDLEVNGVAAVAAGDLVL